MHVLHAALAGLIDYAGLFPPADLDLSDVVERHRRYAGAPERWLLGRLVVPVQQLEAAGRLAADGARDSQPASWTITALASLAELEAAAAAIERFNGERWQRRPAVVAVEVPIAHPEDAARVASTLPAGIGRYLEVPLTGDGLRLLDAVAAAGCSAKLRTGGLTADKFPTPGTLAQALAACAGRGLAMKATAGLHHPIRHQYCLTYEPNSATGTMHGFINLLVAALLLHTERGTERDAARVLSEEDPARFSLAVDSVSWDGRSFTPAECQDTRARFLHAVGSCSFEEPVADLQRLGWWPVGA